MSPSTTPRVDRKPPPRKFTESTYRSAKPFLLSEFGGRCAYSLQHVKRVGYKCMEVDHFNPTLRGPARNEYKNFLPATRHCNGSKSDTWPDHQYRKLGARFLNPTKEQDYGVHIFEDIDSHELVGVTPAGKYHIRCCDLNAPHLVIERKERAALGRIIKQYVITLKLPPLLAEKANLVDTASLIRAILESMIPSIPPPPEPSTSGQSPA